MKIKGRFIAVLAAVGLLAALLPALPTGAAAGVVTLTGGEKGQYFSDNTGNNVVNIQVRDDDLSPARSGKARFSNHTAKANFNLANSVVGGENEKVEELSLSDATTPVAGQWMFQLASTARDESGNGSLGNEDVSVVVNGQTQAANTGYNVTVDNTVPGRGITAVTVFSAPRATPGSVIITYETTEYQFSTATPLRLAGTEIRYGTTLAGATNQINVSLVNSLNAQVQTTANTPAGVAAVVTFVYHVRDTKKDNVSVSTTTSGVTRKLTGTETTAETSIFASKIAVVESSDFTKITTQAGNTLNDTSGGGNSDGTVQISELNNSGALGSALQTKLQGLATTEFNLSLTADAEDLTDLLIPASHGDALTVTYADASPAANVVKTATIDLEAPEVTLIQPSNKLFTRANVVTLQASVVDTGAGVDSGAIDIIASFTPGARGTPAPIQSGYTVTNVPNALGEGKHMWAISVEDRVGNTPTVNDPATKANEAAIGAVAPGTAISASDINPFVFTVDISGPVLTGAETGLYLKNAGVTSGAKKETEASNNREWVRATFSLGSGTAPLDPETVSATDFTVGGATPLEAVVNLAGSNVYLKVAELDTSAKPAVRLTGEVRDKAGNPRTDGTVSSGNVADGLSPVLTVTPSAAIAEKSVTVTVTSSERLRLNPSVGLTTSKPVKGTAPTTTGLPVSLQTGALTTWTATYSNPTGAASIQYVVVSGSDLADNAASVGVAANDKDIVSFQVDDAAPGLAFMDAQGNALGSTKQQEGAVWIVAEFDEDEYTGDTYLGVTLDSVSLTDADGNAITSDTGDLFSGSKVACAGGKCATYTLAIDLAPGKYNIEAAGTDSAGNSVTDDVDFEVTARKPFALDLKPGVNLVSIPGNPIGDGGNLNVLFEDEPVNVVTTYDRALDLAGENPWLRSTRDPETGLFTGDISTLQPGEAYFVTADARATVNITLQTVVGELPPTIMVRFGYNAIGYSSISPTPAAQPLDDYLNSIPWTVAYSYDPTPGRGWEVIRPGDGTMAQPGSGYLVFVRFDATLTP
ncbi:MAG: hypothetical protein OYI31_09385 [Chloroflexota bacterium]|nr:hypothetical protein [Chloroflexota bacterium]